MNIPEDSKRLIESAIRLVQRDCWPEEQRLALIADVIRAIYGVGWSDGAIAQVGPAQEAISNLIPKELLQ